MSKRCDEFGSGSWTSGELDLNSIFTLETNAKPHCSTRTLLVNSSGIDNDIDFI
ncbi:hypothetical protein J6590_092575, partial [Homalodisca vitripennis]